MLNDDWIHVFIAYNKRQVAAFLAAGAVGFEMAAAHRGSVFVGRSPWAT